MTTVSTSPSRVGAISKLSLRFLASTLGLLCSVQAFAESTQTRAIPRPRAVPLSAAFAQSLADWDKEQEADAKECALQVAEIKAEDADATIEGGIDLAYEVLLETPGVYSVGVNLKGFCGGPYPSNSTVGVVFDVTTGRRYSPVELYAIAKKSPYGYELVPPVRTMIRKKLIAERGASQQDDECIQVLKNDEFRFAENGFAAFRKEGLQINYSGPHVVRACYAPIVLPYAQLKRFLNKQEAARIGWKE